MQFARRLALGWLLVFSTTTVAIAQTTLVVTREANLRSTPSTALAPVRLLTSGETLTLVTIAPVNSYYHVRTTQNEDGWVYRTLVKIGGTAPAPPPSGPVPLTPGATCGLGIEIVVHPSCPAVGTHGQNVAYSATSDAGLRNMAKRHMPDPACSPKPLAGRLRSLKNFMTTLRGRTDDQDAFQPTRSLEDRHLRRGPQRRRCGG